MVVNSKRNKSTVETLTVSSFAHQTFTESCILHGNVDKTLSLSIRVSQKPFQTENSILELLNFAIY